MRRARETKRKENGQNDVIVFHCPPIRVFYHLLIHIQNLKKKKKKLTEEVKNSNNTTTTKKKKKKKKIDHNIYYYYSSLPFAYEGPRLTHTDTS